MISFFDKYQLAYQIVLNEDPKARSAPIVVEGGTTTIIGTLIGATSKARELGVSIHIVAFNRI